MKKHYQTLGLNEGASQKEIQTAYERLSKELDPKNNDNQEFFIEEYEKVQEAYKALINPSILATEKGAKQVFEKPTPSPKIKSVSPKKLGTETPKKAAVTKSIIFSIVIISLAIIAYKIYYSPKTYERSEIVFNKDLVYVKKDMTLLNGKINDDRHKGEFVNGMKEGLHREWYNNYGQLESEGNYLNGKIEGLWRSWYENGQLKSEENYLNGEIEGLSRSWRENGQLVFEGNYLSGEREGLWRWWHRNSQLESEGKYLSGEREGLWRWWHRNSQLEFEGNYLSGEMEGLWVEWHGNGQLKSEGNYLSGEREGLWRTWYENGQLKSKVNYPI